MIDTSVMNELTKKVSFVIRLFVAASKLNTFKFLTKYTISLKPVKVLCYFVDCEQFLHINMMLSSNILFFK